MVKLRNVAQALAILGGAAVEGYGKGAMADIMAKRQSYMDELEAGRRQAEQEADRSFRSGETEKGREFEREQTGEEREWEKEKIGIQEASGEKRLRLAASLRPKSGGSGRGGSGGARTVAERAIERIATINAKKAGREEYNDDDWLAAYKEVNASKSTSSDRKPAQWELEEEILRGEQSDDPIAQEVAKRLRQRGQNKTSPLERQRLVNEFMDVVDPHKIDRLADPAGTRAKAEAEADKAMRGGEAAPADEVSPQESVTEVEQPGVLDAPATDGKGGDTSQPTPKGQGSKASPFIATTEAELEWAVKNGGPGSWIVFGGQRYQVPGGPEE